MKTIKAWAVFLLALGTFAGVNGQTNSELIPPIVFQDVPLSTCIETLARLENLNCIMSPKLFERPDGTVVEPTVTHTWKNATYQEALAQLLKVNGLVAIEDKTTSITIFARANQTLPQVDAGLLGNDSETNVPVVLQDVPLDIAFHALTRLAKVEVALDPKISNPVDAKGQEVPTPTVSVHWENVTYRQAIIALCKAYDLVIVKDFTTGAVTIKPKD